MGVEGFNLFLLCLLRWTFLALFFRSKQMNSLVWQLWLESFLSGWPSVNFELKRPEFHDIFSKVREEVKNFKTGHSSLRWNFDEIHDDVFECFAILYFLFFVFRVKLILMPKSGNLIEFKHIDLMNEIMIAFGKVLKHTCWEHSHADWERLWKDVVVVGFCVWFFEVLELFRREKSSAFRWRWLIDIVIWRDG